MRHLFSKLMMFVALALLWLPAVTYCWNAFAPWQWQSKPLLGVLAASPKRAPLSPAAFANQSFQHALAKTIGPSIPFFGDAVRLHNQVVYAALGLSPSQHILIGRDQYLFDATYTKSYCRRDIAASAAEFTSWAQRLREIQDIVQARGQTFLYVLTPSKVEHLPEVMPPRFPCLSNDRQRFVAAALFHLDAAGVKYIDATARTNEIKKKYGYEPFARYGIHWTDLAAYPTTMDIIQAINAAKGRQAIIPYDIAVSRARRPALSDYDYGSMLNIMWTPEPRDTAEFTVVTPAPLLCPEPVSIVTVGGSFFAALGRNLSRGPCPPKVEHLFYLVLNTHRYEGGLLKIAGKADQDLLRPADVLVLEENVGILLQTKHIAALHDYLRTGTLPHISLH